MKNSETYPKSCAILEPDLALKASKTCCCVKTAETRAPGDEESVSTNDGDLVSRIFWPLKQISALLND